MHKIDGKWSLLLAAMLLGSSAALAQGVVEECIQQGYKPGTAGFYHCLQSGSHSRSDSSQSPQSGEAGSILNGDPDNAVTDYSGSTMDGAPSPDPKILKQLNSGGQPNR